MPPPPLFGHNPWPEVKMRGAIRQELDPKQGTIATHNALQVKALVVERSLKPGTSGYEGFQKALYQEFKYNHATLQYMDRI